MGTWANCGIDFEVLASGFRNRILAEKRETGNEKGPVVSM
jgi:hypothetical protein